MRQPILSRPIYLAVLSYCAFVGIGPILVDLMGNRAGIALTPWTIGVTWIGFIALIGGYFCVQATNSASKRGSTTITDLKLSPRTVGRLAFGAAVIGIAGALANIFLINGGHIYQAYQDRANASIVAFPCMLLRPALYFFIVWVRTRRIIRTWHWLAIAVLLMTDVMWFGPVSGSRHQVITLLLTVTFLLKPVLLGRRLRLFASFQVSIIAMAAIAMILVWGAVRLDRPTDIGTSSSISSEGVQTSAIMGLYEPFDAFTRIVTTFPNTIPYLHGESVYETITIPIPRDLWPSKPGAFGVWLQDVLYGYGTSTTNNSVPTLPGELYLNFGWPAVLIGMLIVGFFCRKLAFKEAAPGEREPSLRGSMMYAATFPVLVDAIWGGTGSTLWYFCGDTIPVFLGLLWAAKPNRVAEAA